MHSPNQIWVKNIFFHIKYPVFFPKNIDIEWFFCSVKQLVDSDMQRWQNRAFVCLLMLIDLVLCVFYLFVCFLFVCFVFIFVLCLSVFILVGKLLVDFQIFIKLNILFLIISVSVEIMILFWYYLGQICNKIGADLA